MTRAELVSGSSSWWQLSVAQQAPPGGEAGRKVRIGISEFAPLVVRGDGSPRGFDVELWEATANRLNLETEWVVVGDRLSPAAPPPRPRYAGGG